MDSQVRYVTRHHGFSTDPADTQCRKNQVHHALLCVGGIQFTILSGMILIASMTPRGALRLNPQLISGELGKDFEKVYPPEQVRLGNAHPVSEKDRYSSSIAGTEAGTEPGTGPDIKRDTSYDAASVASPTTPTSQTSPISPISQGSPNSAAEGVFNSADDRERERVLRGQRSASRERKSVGANREWQQPVFETRVHMPTGIRVDLNVSARALPIPPPSPHAPHSPHSSHSPAAAREQAPF